MWLVLTQVGRVEFGEQRHLREVEGGAGLEVPFLQNLVALRLCLEKYPQELHSDSDSDSDSCLLNVCLFGSMKSAGDGQQ
jgi:hypothetical protein